MLTRQQLIAQIKQKGSFLCVGLDTDINKIPVFFCLIVQTLYWNLTSAL